MIVLDSSFLVAYYNTRDIHHGAAARTMVQLIGGKWGQGLLLEYVFLETVTVLRARRDVKVATDSKGKHYFQASQSISSHALTYSLILPTPPPINLPPPPPKPPAPWTSSRHSY